MDEKTWHVREVHNGEASDDVVNEQWGPLIQGTL